MQRKVIQIADSTQLVSIPRQWAKKHNIKKGDELEVVEKGNKLEISFESEIVFQKENLDISNFGPMILRSLMALYKRGVDEITITYNDEKLVEIIHKALGKEATGYEIIDQTTGRCIVKYVTGEFGDFNSVLRRTFLILINMANETHTALEKQKYDHLQNIAFMEESNNRFTTVCRRMLNKKGYDVKYSIGSLYYIIEEMENLADYYKYLCIYIYKNNNKNTKISKEVLDLLKKTNETLKLFYEIYYKFDKDKLVKIGNFRKEVINNGLDILAKKQGDDVVVTHHIMVIMQKIFCLVGPYLTIYL